jgi:hypothetical protein
VGVPSWRGCTVIVELFPRGWEIVRHGSVLIFGEGDNRVRNFEGEQKRNKKKLGKIHIKKIVCGFIRVFFPAYFARLD